MADKTPSFALEDADCPNDAYVAGYFDGEGTVGFYPRAENVIPRIRIAVKSANLPCLLALQSRFGGTVTVASPPRNKRKSQYRWRIGSIRDCLAFASAVEPYAIEKRAQLELARKWLEHRLAVPRRCRHAAGTAQLIIETREIMLAEKQMDFFVFPVSAKQGTSINDATLKTRTHGDERGLMVTGTMRVVRS